MRVASRLTSEHCYFALGFALIVFGALNGCGAAFTNYVTPKPNDSAYPCHRADGTTVPDAVVCEYVAGKASCCSANFSCQPPPFFCEFEGDPNWPTNTFDARKRATEARTESR